jgi:phage tail P2-like protein
MQNIRNFNLLSLVPPSLQSDPQVIAACGALQGEIQAVSVAVDQIMIISKLSQQPSEVIDNLAWQWSTDFYDDSLPLATRIALVQNSLKWHMIKGTPAVVQEMVSTVLSNGVVTEWFQYAGQPYHFRVQTDEIISTQAIYNQLAAVIAATQNIRSWLDCILINRQWSGAVYIGGAIYRGQTFKIGMAQFPNHTISGADYIGGAIYIGKIFTI